MARRRTVLALVALALVAGGVATWWTTRIPAVAAVAVTSAPLVRTLVFSGRVATLSRVDVGSTVTGRALEVAVREGDSVRRSDVLVRLESDELRAALAQARANVAQAAARLAGLRSTGRRTAAAAVAQADSVLLAAQADLERTTDLVSRGFVSQARLDEARRAVAVAGAQLSGARAQSAANDERGTDVAQAEAQLALARSAVAASQARLEQTVLTAPADARVLVRTVEPGQIVQPGRTLVSLALEGPLQLVALADERYLQQLQVAQPARVVADAFPSEPFPASVLSIAPLVDAQRGAVEIKLVPTRTPPTFLREDMTLSVEVETGRRERALVVPAQALTASPNDATATVRLAREGRVEARTVALGLRTLEAAEVVAGLREGDLVLIGPAPPPGHRVRADVSLGAASQRTPRAAGNVGATMGEAFGR